MNWTRYDGDLLSDCGRYRIRFVSHGPAERYAVWRGPLHVCEVEELDDAKDTALRHSLRWDLGEPEGE